MIGLFTSLTSGCSSRAVDEGSTEGDEDSNLTMSEDDGGIQLTINRDVDVLFVIDNSGSMGEAQASLSRSFSVFIDVLEKAEANYRIGVTTTDNGNPLCGST
ncbi:MAG: VWA domain-containing protein, partial [Deltaproteobacteria bacterium]|nr:VWA domain-containing protein [Nannocystaceae bacterium]